MNRVDHHLHEMNLVALDLDVLGCQNGHGHVDETFDAVVNVTA